MSIKGLVRDIKGSRRLWWIWRDIEVYKRISSD